MDLSGRFNFWHMLLHTRAVIPPRLAESRWLRWAIVLVLVGAAGGTAVHFSLQQAPLQAIAVDRPLADPQPTPASKPPPKPASRAPNW
ncbi:MAG: hypothetical protein JOY64_11835 [Alphaproteobacteria bacterium]|nr:hypothetical protein [Alphaproteobacteria bacterium]MBV8408315.1 hypothetical protein [Alphaproteobacteria bacterium]